MSNRYSRSELKDLVIDALLDQVVAIRQLTGSQSLLSASQRREIQLQSDNMELQKLIQFWKTATEETFGLDLIAQADLAQNGPHNDEQV